MLGLVSKLQKKSSKPKRSYGFIEGYDGEIYYFNLRSVKGEVEVGDEVKFRGSLNEKGGYATDIQAINR